MAIPQPIATDQLNAPDHSLLHRQIATDPAGAVKSVTVDADGRVCNTFIVEPNSPSIDTISKAMVLAAAGDTILVAPGTYTETVTFSQDNLTLRALGSAENTIITQATATAVDFSTKSGCTIDGFTVSVTAADGITDYCIDSSNDAASDYNIIQNCIIDWDSTVVLDGTAAIYVDDGNTIIRNNRIFATNTYADTTACGVYGVNVNLGAAATTYIYNNVIDVDAFTTDGSASVSGIICNRGTLYCQNNIITVDTAGLTSHLGKGLDIGAAAATSAYIIGNTINVIASSTATAFGIVGNASNATTYTIGNFINCTTSDTDGQWLDDSLVGYATGNIVTGDCAYDPPATAYVGGNLIKTKAAYNGGDNTTYTNFKAGVCVGADALNNILDDGSHGSGSGALYLGNATIDTVFTGQHYYQLGDTDLEVGECVRLSKDKKIYRTKVAKDESAIGIYWGLPNTEDAFLNEKTSYAVAVIGDSREIHDTYPLTGAWVTTDAGIVKNGDYLCSSTRDGWLEKQTDDVMHSYTVAQARQDINTDTKIAYVYLVQ